MMFRVQAVHDQVEACVLHAWQAVWHGTERALREVEMLVLFGNPPDELAGSPLKPPFKGWNVFLSANCIMLQLLWTGDLKLRYISDEARHGSWNPGESISRLNIKSGASYDWTRIQEVVIRIWHVVAGHRQSLG